MYELAYTFIHTQEHRKISTVSHQHTYLLTHAHKCTQTYKYAETCTLTYMIIFKHLHAKYGHIQKFIYNSLTNITHDFHIHNHSHCPINMLTYTERLLLTYIC